MDSLDDAIFVDAYDSLQLRDFSVFDEIVGQSETMNDGLIAMVTHPFQDGRAHASVAYAVFDGDDLAEFLADFV